MWNDRRLYVQSPPRYHQVASLKSIIELLLGLSEQWRLKRNFVSYADLGSGNCNGTKFFSDFLRNITKIPVKAVGIDASASCEVSCRNEGLDFLCVNLDGGILPLQDVQVITLFETIEHVFQTDRLLQTIRAAISEDGVLLVSTLNVVCWKNRILVPLGIQPFNTEVSTRKLSYGYRLESLKRRMETWKPAGHIRPFTLYSLSEMLQENGFEVIRSYGLENWRAFKFLETIAKNMCTGILVAAKPSSPMK